MKLIVPILLNSALVFAVYLAYRSERAKKVPYKTKQVIIGILFGCVSAFASSYGVQWLGTTVNVRDAAPLSAGLIFGAPAGIISGRPPISARSAMKCSNPALRKRSLRSIHRRPGN